MRRQIFRLHWNDQKIRHAEGIDRQQVEVGTTIENDGIEPLANGIHFLRQSLLAPHFGTKLASNG